MNSINFFNDKKKFPLSTQVLDFLQNMIKQAHKLALVGGGDKYILTGCVETAANTWSDGYVVVAGEILPFTGGTGTAASSVRIKETKADIVAEYDTYSEALTARILEFGSNVGGANTFTWSDFVRVKTNIELAAQYANKTELTALSNLLLPKGGIIMWSGIIAAIPEGFAVCNGANVAGYGVVPDLRGRFIVGYDERTANIPANVTDGKEINYGAIGNMGGKPNVILSVNEIPAHSHEIDRDDASGGGAPQLQDEGGTNPSLETMNTRQTGGGLSHENRPPYLVLAYIIKVV